MKDVRRNTFIVLCYRLNKKQRGLSLLEVLISTVVLGIAMTGFLMALSTATTTTKVAVDESKLVYLASKELEALRSVPFDPVPFVQTAEPGTEIEVPNYFTDLAVTQDEGGLIKDVIASGDLRPDPTSPTTVNEEYLRNYAFDGKGAEFNVRWMGDTNALAYRDDGPSGGGPGGGTTPGGGDGPSAGGPGGGPGGEENPYAPDDFQWIYGAFSQKVKIARILYDNRFNVTEEMEESSDDFDYFPHDKDVWQRSFNIFWSDKVLGPGEILDPWQQDVNNLFYINDLGYGSTGVWKVFDDPEHPLEAAIIGVMNIDTYSDFDIDFHWPYVSEIEVYGFSKATNYVDYWEDNGVGNFDNVIMYFPNYLESGYDLGRRVFIKADPSTDPDEISTDLFTVEIEFFKSQISNNNATWQRETWWQVDGNELARFETSFYRDETTRIDRLPNLEDYPTHLVYDDNENLDFSFTVPGARAIRGRFGTFNLEPPLGGPIGDDDHVKVKDKDGNIYAEVNGLGIPNPDYGTWPWSPWVTGDTLVIQFVSNDSLNSYDSGFSGFAIDQIEIRWDGFDEGG